MEGERPGWQGRTGAQTCAPRPAPPGEICAPRPAPPCAPGLTRVTTPLSPSAAISVWPPSDASLTLTADCLDHADC